MKTSPLIILLLVLMTSFIQSAAGQAISPHVSDGFPVQVGILMDGGSFYVHERTLKKQSNIFRFDGRLQTKTPGKLFVATKPDLSDEREVSREKAHEAFARWKTALEKHYGKEEYRRLSAEVFDIEKLNKDFERKLADKTDEEAAAIEERFLRDKKLQNKIALQMLTVQVKQYEVSHLAPDTEKPARKSEKRKN